MYRQTLIRAAALAVLIASYAGAAMAQGEAASVAAAETAPSVAPAAPVAPWYQSFTQDGVRYDLGGAPLQRSESTLDIPTGNNWGVSLGFEKGASRGGSENVEGLSAGAYFKVSPRVRVGGELGYRAGQSDAVGLRPQDEVGSSQVKLESAFRF